MVVNVIHHTGTHMNWLNHPTRFLFFTGKGGVGKTSLSTATAIALADSGRRVLLVSTDAASNLDEMLGMPLSNHPAPVPHVPGLDMLNIDPDAAANAYRQRVLAQMGPQAGEDERAEVLEQLSGACTTEIASFDEFSSLLASASPGTTTADPASSTATSTGTTTGPGYDHVVFDTAPSGHTLRLLSLPKAWSGFLAGNDRGASCLGPHSGLKMQEVRFNQALAALSNPALTTVVLVTRPEVGALAEAARTAQELLALGLTHQRLIINGVFRRTVQADAMASAIEAQGQQALDGMPDALRTLPQDTVPLRPRDNMGVAALRALLSPGPTALPPLPSANPDDHGKPMPPLSELVAEFARSDHALIMVMGKGGVGKTTIAAAIALGLAQRGKTVHLSTTDPAAHLQATLGSEVAGLEVSRIDPKAETARYIDKIMAARGPGLDAHERDLLLEDLQSPCTEEVAVFHAFSRTVAQARSAFVVLDTAPTGHSLLLMDAAGAYHRQMQREFEGSKGLNIVTPLMRLQDASYTRIVLVTLPEVTPVSQAAALQADLRRAHIEPCAWVLNRSVLAAGTQDPLLAARLEGERQQIARIRDGLASRLVVIPWMTEPPVGVTGLQALLA